METSKDWLETEKFLNNVESLTLADEPKLLKANLLDFVRSPAENKERQLTAMSRRMEVGVKDRAAALKYRDQEIRLKKMGFDNTAINIAPIQQFLGISQTIVLLEQDAGSRSSRASDKTKAATRSASAKR